MFYILQVAYETSMSDGPEVAEDLMINLNTFFDMFFENQKNKDKLRPQKNDYL